MWAAARPACICYMLCINIATRTSHYERFTVSGTGYILNDGRGPRPGRAEQKTFTTFMYFKRVLGFANTERPC
jgi:hypothetical protein